MDMDEESNTCFEEKYGYSYALQLDNMIALFNMGEGLELTLGVLPKHLISLTEGGYEEKFKELTEAYRCFQLQHANVDEMDALSNVAVQCTFWPDVKKMFVKVYGEEIKSIGLTDQMKFSYRSLLEEAGYSF